MSLQFPRFFRPLKETIIWQKDTSSKVVYLTFDDGPVPEVTYKVLDILDDYMIKATFFCVGENVEKYPQVYQEVLRRGHVCGNHTYNHIKGFSVSTQYYIDNVAKAASLIDSKLFRPPYGRIKPSQLRRLLPDYQIVMWDVITHDYNKNLSSRQVMHNVTKYTRNGSVIVFHDSIKASGHVLRVLPEAIEFLKQKGFEFAVL